MENSIELEKTTLELLSHIDQANQHFLLIKETGKAPEFYEEVKPFSNMVIQTVEMWGNCAKKWVVEGSPKTIHLNQLEATAKNIEMVAVQSFYPTTSRGKFNNMVKSINYVLHSILLELNQE